MALMHRGIFVATHLRCRVHWMRNAVAHAPAKRRRAVAAMLKTIYAQENKADTEVRWEVVADALRGKQARLGALDLSEGRRSCTISQGISP
ncbi:transposase [Citreicella sp. SE45]|nr:transposase [Citreicella sp. SE45]